MEQKFNNNRLDLQILRELCEREGEEIAYRKGDQLEREGDPARWFAWHILRGSRLRASSYVTTPHFSMAVRHRPQLRQWYPAVY